MTTLLRYACLFILLVPLRAADPGVAVVGKARFTVVTPNLIRMEYAPDGKFVDAPSWFAVEREVRDEKAKITQVAGKVEIDTGTIHLSYTDDGQPFSQANLQAEIKSGDIDATWKPGMHSQNLGGTIRTLDRARGPVRLDDGVLSREGWYLLDDSQSPLFTKNWIEERPKNKGQDWYLFGYGHDYKAALHSLTAISGPVPLPRKYTLGIWYSRYWPYKADEFKQIVQEYEEHGFPLDNIVMDMDWHLNKTTIPGVETWTGYTWDKALIPDPPALLKWFHDQGLHVTLNDHPAKGIQPHEAMYADFMHAMGQDPSTQKTIPFDAGDKRYLDMHYKYAHLPREKDGVDFWWLDWQQYEKTVSLPDVTNLQVLNFFNYTHEEKDGLRGQSFSRWAGWGDHRYPIEFSGDADTGWPMLAFEVPFTSTAGNAGAFFWSHDTGGHMGGRNEESYTRGCQFGAFTAALRSHSTRNSEMDRRPWTYPDWAEASMHVSFRLRAEMMPYLYTSIWQGTHDSVPFIRPLYIDNPGTEQAYHNGQEYLFGDNLLVAPIMQPGVGPNRVATQSVWFPKGEWFDYFTGEEFSGPAQAIAAAPIDEFPLYVRGGVPLPMQVYTNRPGTHPLTDLVLRCYPGTDGQTGVSQVYEDDGVTNGYRHDAFATTKLTYARHGDEITISAAPTKGEFKGQPKSRRCVVELPCTEKLSSCNAADAKTSYDDHLFVNRIELPSASVRSGWKLTVHAVAIDATTLSQRAVARHEQDVLGEPFDSWKAKNVPLPEELAAAFAAAQGYALFEQPQHPYFLDKKNVLLYIHNHHDAPESASLAIGDAPTQTVSLQPGAPVPGLPDDAPSATKPVFVSFPGVNLTLREPTVIAANLDPAIDLARQAKAEASSGAPEAAIDGVAEGYPRNRKTEWATLNEKTGAWLKLTWPQPIKANTVYLYDRPNSDDHVLAGTLEFDDGSKLEVGPLPDSGAIPLRVPFPTKTVSWMKFTVTQVSPQTKNTGLAEISVTQESGR